MAVVMGAGCTARQKGHTIFSRAHQLSLRALLAWLSPLSLLPLLMSDTSLPLLAPGGPAWHVQQTSESVLSSEATLCAAVM